MCNGGEASAKSNAIDVVLHEYDSLRAEIQDRMVARFQLIGYLGIAATLLGTTDISKLSRVLLITFAVIGFIIVWFSFGFYIRRLARRLREIEKEVNEKLGEEVLVWESKKVPRGRFPYNLIR
jgi:ABC-type multidrug transport system fused ATPase/permease subunit